MSARRMTTRGRLRLFAAMALGALLSITAPAETRAVEPAEAASTSPDETDRLVTLVVRDTEVREVFEMLSRTEGLSIAMSDEVQAKVSISLFDVEPEEALEAVAQAAGYAVEHE